MPDDAVIHARAFKDAGLDYVDVSSGGITVDTRTPSDPGYNAPLAERVRRGAGLPTRTVGMIVTPKQAEAILASGQADMIALGRTILDDPHWPWHAALELGGDVARPPQYLRAAAKMWPGAKYRLARS